MGKVTTMIDGIASTKMRKAAQADAPYVLIRLAIRYSVPVPMNTAVKAQTPNKNGLINSFNIYLSNIRILSPCLLHSEVVA